MAWKAGRHEGRHKTDGQRDCPAVDWQGLAALATLVCALVGGLAEREGGAGADVGLGAVARVEGLARNDAVDLCREEKKQKLAGDVAGRGAEQPSSLRRSSSRTCGWADGIRARGRYVPVRMFWKASSTLLASRADVSMKERWFSPAGNGQSANGAAQGRLHRNDDILAKALASSVGTARRWRKSLLFPTSMMTMLASAWSRSSLSHLVTFS
jgi:hypothetical protein